MPIRALPLQRRNATRYSGGMDKPPRSSRGEILMVDPARVWRAAIGGIGDTKRPDDVRRKWRSGHVQVMGGDWDNGEWGTKIARLDTYQPYILMHQRFVQGMAWEDTAFYKKFAAKLDRGEAITRPKITDPANARAELREHLASRYDALFADIRDRGYRTQAELGHPHSLEEIRIGIDRDGHLIVLGGRHRLSMVQILKIDKVPMRLVVRHQQWDEFRTHIIEQARSRWNGKVYQKLSHPDLSLLPGVHEEHKRVALIRDALPAGSGRTLLDLGTHWGYWLEQMERLGFKCTGVEMREADAEIARKLGVANDAQYDIWQGNLTTYPQPKADVVLALSIFHHLVSTDEKHARLTAFLQRLDTPLMFFEPPTKRVERYQPEEFVRFVSEHARLPNLQLLGTTGNRPIYRLARS